MRRSIVITLAGLALALALLTSAGPAQDRPDSCPPLDPSFCVQEEESSGMSPAVLVPLIALFWVTPLVLAGVFAARHGENVSTAVGLTFFLGWIGLFIAYRGQRRSAVSLMHAADPAASRSARRFPSRPQRDFV